MVSHADHASLFALIENTDDSIWSVDAQYRLILGNSVFHRNVQDVLGHSFVIGESVFHESFTLGTIATWRQRYDRALRGERFRFEAQNQFGAARYVEYSLSPIIAADGQVTGVTVVGRDITERKEAEDEIRFQAHMLDSVGQAIIATDLAGTITYWNCAAEYLYGWTKGDMLGKSVMEVLPSNTIRTQAGAIMEQLTRGETWRGEFLVPRQDGTSFPAIITDTPLLDQRGHLIGIISVSTDITEQKYLQDQTSAALVEKEALLKEIHHRVKNNLQLVSSILEMHARIAQDEAISSALLENQMRIQSIAAMHELLYQSSDLARINMHSYVTRLMSHLRQIFPHPMVAVQVDVQPVELTLDVAIPCGLIINELVSNAFKHAFPAGIGGELMLQVVIVDDQIELTIRNSGQLLPPDFELDTHRALGLRLVTIFVRQLDGTFERLPDPAYTVFRLSFPASE